MADLPPLPDQGSLDRALAAIGSRLAYPPTPDLHAGVASRLAAGWPPRGARRLPVSGRWRLLLAAAVLALLACGLALALPGTRSTIAERLGLRGLRITFEPASVTPSATAPSSGAGLRLGEATTLGRARQEAGFTIRVPGDAVLGAPDGVYLAEAAGGRRLSLAYRPRGGLPETRETGVGLLVQEFQATLEPALVKKMLTSDTRIEVVTVNGRVGYWIEGAPHILLYRAPDGRIEQDESRLAGNTLLWEQDGVIIRIESALGKAEVLRIAESLR